MKVVGPVDLVPEPSLLEQWVQKEIDAAIVAELEALIKGKLILTGDGVKHGN